MTILLLNNYKTSTDLFHKEFDKFGTLTSSSQSVSSSLASCESTDFMIIKIEQKV